MRTRSVSPGLLLVLLVGCQDPPLAPELETRSAPLLAMAQVPAAPSFVCTHHWVGGASLRWSDPRNWSPAAVPDSLDSACVDAPGSYPVVSDYYVRVRNLRIGGPGAVPFVTHAPPVPSIGGGWYFDVEDELIIDANASLHLVEVGSYSLGEGTAITNHGLLKTGTPGTGAAAAFPWITLHRFFNFGTIEFLNYTDFEITEGGSFENHGEIRTERSGTVKFEGHGTFVQAGGSIGGDWSLYVRGEGAPAAIPEFRWNGGTLGEQSVFPGEAAVKLTDMDVRLNTTALSGLLELRTDRADSVSVAGSVGPEVGLTILGLSDGVLRFRRQVPGALYQNRGAIEVIPFLGVDLALIFDEGLENLGSLTQAGASSVRLEADSVVNRGAIEVRSANELELSGSSGPGFVRNTGTIIAQPTTDPAIPDGRVRVGPGVTFESTASGTMTGRMDLRDATLRGVGSVGDVFSFGGSIHPGVPFGTLTLEGLHLDAQSNVVLEVADPLSTGHDQLDVQAEVALAGQLSIVTIPPFRGGRCGQVVPLLTHNAAVPLSGQFATVQGLAQANPHAWRVDTQPGLLQIAGYTTGPAPLSLEQASVVVTEGRAGKSLYACLGRRAPAADVQLSSNGGAGQLTITPSALFDLPTWRLPRRLSVVAIDDAVSENTQVYPVTHTLSSTDPAYNAVPGVLLDVTVIDDDTAADLSVTLVSQEDNQFVGDTMDTVFRVTNAGPFAATGVAVTSTPLVGLTFLSATGAGCSLDGANVLTCTLGTQGPAAQLEFTLRFRGATVGFHSNTLTVSGNEVDPVPGNNAVVTTQRVN